MYCQLLFLFFIGIVTSTLSTALYGCPDDTYTYKKLNGTAKCYKIYRAQHSPLDMWCTLIDYCRPLHPNAIPATISSIEEREFLKTLVKDDAIVLIGVYIPCPKKFDEKSFINVDGTPIPAYPEHMDKADDDVLVMIQDNITEDAALRTYGPGAYLNDVLCAITVNPSPCPDETYMYHVINGIGKCYKNITVPYKIDRCDLINVCRQLNPDAIPATIGSIEEREYMKTIVDPNEYVAIGVSIPCPLRYNVHKYKNIDGTSLPAPLEVTTGTWPDQFIGMLFHHKTDNFAANDPDYHGQVLCSIPIWFSCPPGTYPDSYDDTRCVQYVPYVPGSTPEATCANANSQYQPPPEIPCSLPHGIAHEKPQQLPYCSY